MEPRAIPQKEDDSDMVDIDLTSTDNGTNSTSLVVAAATKNKLPSSQITHRDQVPRRVSMTGRAPPSSRPIYTFAPLKDITPFDTSPTSSMSKAEKAKAKVIEETQRKAQGDKDKRDGYSEIARDFLVATGSRVLGSFGTEFIVSGARKRAQSRLKAQELQLELEEEPVLVGNSVEYTEDSSLVDESVEDRNNAVEGKGTMNKTRDGNNGVWGAV